MNESRTDWFAQYKRYRLAPIFLAVALLAGCIYLPMTTDVYSPECARTLKHITLTSEQVGAFVVCDHEACVALLVLAGVVSAASAVVSGSIVVIGKAVYWIENQINCLDPMQAQPASSGD